MVEIKTDKPDKQNPLDEEKSPQYETYPRSKFWIDIRTLPVLTITMFAVIKYAILTNGLLENGQAQLAYTERAWVSISEKGVGTTPIVFDNTRKYTAGVSYDLKNYSDNVATKVFSGAMVIVPLDQNSRPKFSEISQPGNPCGAEEQRGSDNGIMVSNGSVLFPDSSLHVPVTSIGVVPPGLTIFDHAWLEICINYRDQANVVRHTRLLFKSTSNANDAPIVENGITHKPIVGWADWDAYAD